MQKYMCMCVCVHGSNKYVFLNKGNNLKSNKKMGVTGDEVIKGERRSSENQKAAVPEDRRIMAAFLQCRMMMWKVTVNDGVPGGTLSQVSQECTENSQCLKSISEASSSKM